MNSGSTLRILLSSTVQSYASCLSVNTYLALPFYIRLTQLRLLKVKIYNVLMFYLFLLYPCWKFLSFDMTCSLNRELPVFSSGGY